MRKKANSVDKNSPEYWVKMITGGRASLLLIVVLTVVNIVLLLIEADRYFVFSASIPYYLTAFAMGMDSVFSSGIGTYTIIAIVISVIVVGIYLLCWALADWKAPLPGFLTGIFSASVVGAGNDNWGYVFPFFASNLLANIYGYIQNKKTTFKSDAPAWCFAVYLALMVCLILFSTWLQGVIANALRSTGAELWSALAPTIAAAAAGTFQMAVLFPVEKFVLLKEKKE